MIYGIGVDLVKVCRINHFFEQKKEEKFARKILNDREYAFFVSVLEKNKLKSVLFLAKAFAAKEAVAKALGTGFRQGVFFKDIEIIKNSVNKPSIVLYGNALQLSEKKQIKMIHISLSDEQDCVIAFVIMEV